MKDEQNLKLPSEERSSPKRFISQEDANWVQEWFPPGPKALQDELLSLRYRRYIMDVIKLNDYCEERHGYNIDKHGSLDDFLKNVLFKGNPDNHVRIKRLLAIS